MEQVKIEKDIYVRDEFKVRRVAFKAGSLVNKNDYNRVLTTDTVVNTEDLPDVEVEAPKNLSVNSSVMETKALDEPKVEVLTSDKGAPVSRERVSEAEGQAKAVEATAKVAASTSKGADNPVPVVKEEVVAEAEADEVEVKAESKVEPKAKKSKKEGK